MNIKLYDSELRVMDVLWKTKEATASRIAKILKERHGYRNTTTYTLIKRCVDKGAAKRTDPGFYCSAVITQAQVQKYETSELIKKLFDGSADQLIDSVLNSKELSPDEIERIMHIVTEWSKNVRQ